MLIFFIGDFIFYTMNLANTSDQLLFGSIMDSCATLSLSNSTRLEFDWIQIEYIFLCL